MKNCNTIVQIARKYLEIRFIYFFLRKNCILECDLDIWIRCYKKILLSLYFFLFPIFSYFDHIIHYYILYERDEFPVTKLKMKLRLFAKYCSNFRISRFSRTMNVHC